MGLRGGGGFKKLKVTDTLLQTGEDTDRFGSRRCTAWIIFLDSRPHLTVNVVVNFGRRDGRKSSN